jgi:hypothetical protein
MTAGQTRVFPVPSGGCSLPSNAVAYSFNIAVVPSGTAMRWLTAFPDGTAMPTMATLNDKAGLVTSNAAVVEAGSYGAVDVYVTDATDVIIDVNGYYAPEGDGYGNLAFGRGGLASLTTGEWNTAVGEFAGGYLNTGSSNVVVGATALGFTTTSSNDTAVGYDAMGYGLSGGSNVAVGSQALVADSVGTGNIVIGYYAGYNGTVGSYNIVLGYEAGANNNGGNNNIYIANAGSTLDSNVTRIGSGQNAAFISGIRGVTTGSSGAVPVVIDGNGQLGTASSSRKVKRDIADMGDTTETLMSLHPVQFRYIAHGPDAPLQYGLIAEEVAEVAPELVARKADGEVETVFYDKVNAMLLNQVQTQQRQIEAQRTQLQAQSQEINDLSSRLAELESRVK